MSMKHMCCPYFVNDIKKRVKNNQGKENRQLVGVQCECATIRFPSNKARRNFVYPLCGSVDGFYDCPIYQFQAAEEE